MKQRIEQISSGLNELLAEAEALLESLAGPAHAAGESADRTHETVQRVCAQLRGARDTIVNGAGKVDGAVHAHPWRALAASALAGFIAGLLVRRR